MSSYSWSILCIFLKSCVPWSIHLSDFLATAFMVRYPAFANKYLVSLHIQFKNILHPSPPSWGPFSSIFGYFLIIWTGILGCELVPKSISTHFLCLWHLWLYSRIYFFVGPIFIFKPRGEGKSWSQGPKNLVLTHFGAPVLSHYECFTSFVGNFLGYVFSLAQFSNDQYSGCIRPPLGGDK